MLTTVKFLAEWERVVVLRFGRPAGVKGPGFIFIAPMMDKLIRVDTRVICEVLEVKSETEYCVDMSGKRWDAESVGPLSIGDKVKIKSINNLLLNVTKLTKET